MAQTQTWTMIMSLSLRPWPRKIMKRESVYSEGETEEEGWGERMLGGEERGERTVLWRPLSVNTSLGVNPKTQSIGRSWYTWSRGLRRMNLNWMMYMWASLVVPMNSRPGTEYRRSLVSASDGQETKPAAPGGNGENPVWKITCLDNISMLASSLMNFNLED